MTSCACFSGEGEAAPAAECEAPELEEQQPAVEESAVEEPAVEESAAEDPATDTPQSLEPKETPSDKSDEEQDVSAMEVEWSGRERGKEFHTVFEERLVQAFHLLSYFGVAEFCLI